MKARLFSMVVMLLVIGLLYSRAKEAKMWTWLVHDAESDDAVFQSSATSPAEPWKETILPGPTDLDEGQPEGAKKLLAAVTDRQKLVDVEMPAYWRLLGWAQRQSFADLDRRAQRDVALTKLHEQPDLYRGQLIRLRLNVRRALSWPAPVNSAGVTRVYEASGPTTESRARPYSVVFADPPPGFKVGTEVDQDVVFVGYFLKWIQYEKYDGTKQSAPLLIGRLNPAPASVAPATQSRWSIWDFLFMAGGVAIIAFGLRSAFRRNEPQRRLLAAEGDEESALEFFKTGGERPDEKTQPVEAQSSNGTD